MSGACLSAVKGGVEAHLGRGPSVPWAPGWVGPASSRHFGAHHFLAGLPGIPTPQHGIPQEPTLLHSWSKPLRD